MAKPEFIKTENFYSRDGHTPELIVLHIMLGTMEGTIEWFQNPTSDASAHYLVGKDGRVVQMVEEDDAAWHAGRINKPTSTAKEVLKKSFGRYINPNRYSIGIECEAEAGEKWTEKQMKALAELVHDIAARNHIPLDDEHILIHKEITTDKPEISAWRREVLIRLNAYDKAAIKAQIIELLNKL